MKLYIRSMQSIFAGTHYDKNAAKKLVESTLYTEEEAEELVNNLFKRDIHAFVHAPNWVEKYIVGIIRMGLEEGAGNKQATTNFLTSKVEFFDKFLSYVKENREALGGSAFDTQFKDVLHYQDIKNMLKKVQEELDRKSEEELAKMRENEMAASKYELVPITSYDQLHNMFGGHWTGDGSSDAYAGGGGTAWCHTNSRSVYDSWTKRGSGCKFYILARKDFKDIPFNRETNSKDPKDEYGNSLIALLVDKKTGNLVYATLRCNHVGVSMNADNQYKTYSELSQLAGFNVKDVILADLGATSGELAIKKVSLDKEKFALGDNISLEVRGYGTFSATAVLRTGNETYFVFDDVLGYGKMINMPTRLDNILNGIAGEEPDFADRIIEVRLLTASEIFSGCDDSDEWSYLSDFGVERDGDQIPYFVPSEHRQLDTEENRGWWTGSMSDDEHYVVVKNDGGGNCFNDKKRRGL